jgi:hypothetical protein
MVMKKSKNKDKDKKKGKKKGKSTGKKGKSMVVLSQMTTEIFHLRSMLTQRESGAC